MHRSAFLLLVSGCATAEPCPEGSAREKDGLCYLLGDAPGDSATPDGSDSGDPDPDPDPGTETGDPILTRGTSETEPGAMLVEWVDAAMINDDYGLVVGQGGYGVIDARTGALVVKGDERRGLRVATDGNLAAIATRTDGMPLLDLTDPLNPARLNSLRFDGIDGPHEDVAVDGGRILLGYHSNGALLLNAEGTTLTTIPGDDIFAVALQGDRALVTDGTALELWDLTDLGAPVQLATTTMSAEGRDLAWQGEHVAVGMGGGGTGVWSLVGDVFTHRADLFTPGSALSVDIDEDRLWIGAWEVSALADLAVEPPVVIGHESPTFSAMGIAAAGGRAVVADWFASAALEAVDGMRSPEVVPPRDLYFPLDSDIALAATFENGGTGELVISVDAPSDGYTVSPTSLALAPGAAGVVVVTPPSDGRPRTTMRWSSNDIDEPEGTVLLAAADQGVGSEHVDFSLQGFEVPDRSLRTYNFADTRGKVVVLVYWALF